MSTSLENIDKVTSLHKNNELQLLCFRLKEDGDLYAVNVFKIRGVVKYDGEITHVAQNSSSIMEGVVTIRELIIPLVDMKKWFYYDERLKDRDLSDFGVKSVSEDEIFIMICEFSKYTIGVKIYEADRILSKKWTEIEQVSGIGAGSEGGKVISRTKYFDGSIVQVVDIEKMLTDIFPWIELEKDDEINSLDAIDVNKIILLADDSPTVLHTMRNILNRLGVKHKDFINGKKLIDFIEEMGEDVSDIGMVITDLEMPEASGFEVIKYVKNSSALSHIPVVVNSSMSGSSNEDMARSLNADEFISKSHPAEIRDIIIKHLL